MVLTSQECIFNVVQTYGTVTVQIGAVPTAQYKTHHTGHLHIPLFSQIPCVTKQAMHPIFHEKILNSIY
jgi:hypothetical protein